MKKLLLVAMLGLSFSAHAGDYTRAAKIDSICKSAAELGEMTFIKKQEGVSYRQMLRQYPSLFSDPLLIRIVSEVYTKTADTEENAYMIAWGVCMDEMENR